MKIDLEKLAYLRDAHTRLHNDYRTTSSLARVAMSETEQLRRELALYAQNNDAAREILSMSAAALGLLGIEKVARSGLDYSRVRRVAESHARALRLKEQASSLSKRLADSSQLMQRINDFAAPLENLQ